MIKLSISPNTTLPYHLEVNINGKEISCELFSVEKTETEVKKTPLNQKISFTASSKDQAIEVLKHIRWEFGQILKAIEANATQVSAELNAAVEVPSTESVATEQ